MENATLYRSLQRKVEDYERLKEFSENIVESINVGILAADLADRVESWNTRMEQLTGVPRESALGQRLADLLPGLPDGAAGANPRAMKGSTISTRSCCLTTAGRIIAKPSSTSPSRRWSPARWSRSGGW